MASGGWDIVVGIASRLRAGRTGVLIPFGGSFLIYRHVQTSSGDYAASPSMGTGSSFLGAQQPERDVDQSRRERVRAPLKKFKGENIAESVIRNMAADRNAVNKPNHYLTVSDTNKKDRNICSVVGLLDPLRTAGPRQFLLLPPVGSVFEGLPSSDFEVEKEWS
jgi:hypothetical protein